MHTPRPRHPLATHHSPRGHESPEGLGRGGPRAAAGWQEWTAWTEGVEPLLRSRGGDRSPSEQRIADSALKAQWG